MLSSVAALAYAPTTPLTGSRTVSAKMDLGTLTTDSKPWGADSDISDKAGMQALAKKLNPTVGFYGECRTMASNTTILLNRSACQVRFY